MLAAKGATLLVTVDCGTTSLEPLAEARKLGMSVVVIDHHQTGDELPEVDALVNPNRRRRSLRPRPSRRRRPGADHAGRGEPRIARPRLLDRRTAGAGSARHAAPCGARHRGRCRAPDRAQPRLRRQGPDRDAPPRPCRPHRADGCGAAERPARSLASRLHAGAAHQCGRPDRARRSRRAAAAGRRRLGSRADRGRTRPAQQRAPRHRAGGGSAGRGRGAGLARARRQGRGHRDRRRRLAPRHRRAGCLAAEGEICAARLCDRAGAGRHRHRLGPLDLGRRSRQGGAAGGEGADTDEGRRPRHGGRA